MKTANQSRQPTREIISPATLDVIGAVWLRSLFGINRNYLAS